MDLHLFSTPGVNDIRYILGASRPYLEDKEDAVVAYLPMASLADPRQAYTEKAFADLATVKTINTETMQLREMEEILRWASLVYIPGGNTFLLNHRLHASGLMPSLRKKIQTGLSVVAFSAGAILCGPNILTSKDMNTVETTYFAGLKVTPFNFFAHYVEASEWSLIYDEWLSDYHIFHENPVIILADGSYVKVEGKKTTLVRGDAWILRKSEEKEKLTEGKLITA